MKQLFALPESAELELLKNMLEEAGIRCALRNEQLSQALPATPFNVELWVANDDDFPRAQELCQAWLHPPPAATGTWVCAQCGQRLRDKVAARQAEIRKQQRLAQERLDKVKAGVRLKCPPDQPLC